MSGLKMAAGFEGFQDAVKRVIKTQNSSVPFEKSNEETDQASKPSEDRNTNMEDNCATMTFSATPKPLSSFSKLQINNNNKARPFNASFQKMVKKVVQKQNVAATNFNNKKRVLYPTKPKSSVQKVPVIGGTPITSETAVALRTKVFGSADLVCSALSEWLGQNFAFNEEGTGQGYSLKTQKVSTRGMAMCVQGYILKHLLFVRRGPKVVGDPALLLRAKTKGQEEALVGAMSDILWKAGDRQKAILCLTQDDIHVRDDTKYQTDGCTERIHMFEFKKQDELTFNLKKYLFEFMSDDGDGMLLLLYSVVLSRGFEKIIEDQGDDDTPLVSTNGSIQPCLATLLLTGKATQYLHNGIIYEGSEDTMAKPKTGILTRGEVGLLVWRRLEGGVTGGPGEGVVGSRLKTPSLPVWVTRCNDVYGILFNPNKDLTRDYHAENRFDLYYYSSTQTQTHTSTPIITIDTRNQTGKDEYQLHPMENLIHTKWQGADVSWNGATPYV